MDESRLKNFGDGDTIVNVRTRYNDLHDLLKSLSTKLSNVSSNVDQEFLCSYRVHMLSIQSEIKHLKEDVKKGEQALNSDGEVAKLETEVKWFLDECGRLRLNYNSMDADCKQMTARYKALCEQKTYLNEQLKAIMKRNRVLQAEIDYVTKNNKFDSSHRSLASSTDNDYAMNDEGDDTRLMMGSADEDFDDDMEFQFQPSAMNQTGGLSSTLPTKGSQSQKMLRNPHAKSTSVLPSKNQKTSSSSGGGALHRNASSPQIGGMHMTTASHSRSPSRGRGGGTGRSSRPIIVNPLSPTILDRETNHIVTKSHQQMLEEFLQAQSPSVSVMEKACMEIFQEIKERKHIQAKEASVKRFPAIIKSKVKTHVSAFHGDAPPITHDEIGIYAKTSIIKAAGGVAGLGLDQFSDNDRFSTIIKFLINYDQFRAVVEKLNEMYQHH